MGAVAAEAVDDEVDVLRSEAVAARQVHAHLLDEIAGVMRDVAAHPAHQMEFVVGMGYLPVTTRLAEAYFLCQAQFGQQRQGSVDAGQIELRGLP